MPPHYTPVSTIDPDRNTTPKRPSAIPTLAGIPRPASYHHHDNDDNKYDSDTKLHSPSQPSPDVSIKISPSNLHIKATPPNEKMLFGYPTSLVLTFFYMALNVSSSVGIVLTNKWVFQVHNFSFGTVLTVIHFLVTFLGLELCARVGMFEKKRLPIWDILPLSASFCGFVVLTNLSLQYNSVGFYQMAKVLTTPCIVLIQTVYYNVQFSTPIKMSLFVTCFGVGIASVTDFQLNFVGTMFALAGVVVTSLYQIWVGTKQKELNANSMQLLYYQAPLSAFLLLFLIPILDDTSALFAYPYNSEALLSIFSSALLAFFVNISIFLVIGKTSPVTYNMVGHFKLCVIVFLGFVIFRYPVDGRNVLGILVTLSGIVWYSQINLRNRK
ncbi:hypothetical protein HK102_006161 [Quaeritorhiza haematococci]|nr:hypothetical protein HK102_006161 [Quaeritorhiza haematococci]